MSGRCLKHIQKVSGEWRVFGMCRKETRKSEESVWRLSGRCLESIKIILSILECSAVSVSITLFLGVKAPLGLASVTCHNSQVNPKKF